VSLPPFDRLVTDYGQVVLRVCRALLPLQDAEDAAADVVAIMCTSEAAARRNAADGIRTLRRSYQAGLGSVPQSSRTRR